MKNINTVTVVLGPLFMFACLCTVCGCDTGEQTIDEVTGNRAVKQYHQS